MKLHDLHELDAVPCADSIVHATFVGGSGAPFERMLDHELHPGDVVAVHEHNEVDHYIVVAREHALVLTDGGDTLVIFLTLNPCIPNNERNNDR